MAEALKAPVLRFGFTFPQSVVYFIARAFFRVWLVTQVVIFIIPAILSGVLSPEIFEFMFREYIDLWNNYAVWAWNALACFNGVGWFAVFWESNVCWWLQPLPFHWPMYYDALPYIFVAGAAALIGLLSPRLWAAVGGWIKSRPRQATKRQEWPAFGAGTSTTSAVDPELFDDEDAAAFGNRDFDEALAEAMRTRRGRKLKALVDDPQTPVPIRDAAMNKLRALPAPDKSEKNRRRA